MELGATVCRKSRPACLLCPVKDHCLAHANGNESRIPVIARRQTRRVHLGRLFLIKGDRLLLHVHPEDSSRPAGLAELPLINAPQDAQPVLKRCRGISTERITEYVYCLHHAHPSAVTCSQMEFSQWVSLSELSRISLSGPHRRWIEELLQQNH